MEKRPAKVRGVYERDSGSGIWWVFYKLRLVHKREKVGRRGDAVALYQRRKTELRAGAKLAPNLRTKAAEGPTFGKLADDALAYSKSRNRKDIRTLEGRLGILKDSFSRMTASDLTTQMIEDRFEDHVDWAPATKNRYRAAISLAYKLGMRNGKVCPRTRLGVEPELKTRVASDICWPRKKKRSVRSCKSITPATCLPWLSLSTPACACPNSTP